MTITGRFWTIRLGLANSVGFGLTTIMPLWAASLGPSLHTSSLVVAGAAAAQLAVCGLANLLTPSLIGARDPVRVAKWALLIASGGALGQALFSVPVFAFAALVGGASVGVLLACTNRLAAAAEHVQESYATYQIVEVTFAGSLLMALGPLIAAYGVRSVFWGLGACQLLGYLAVRGLVGQDEGTGLLRSGHQRAPQWRGFVFLGLLAVFFAGQSSIVSHLVPIGQRAGMSSALVATVMSAGVFCGLFGAAVGRLMGSRFGVVRPVIVGGIGFAIDLCLLGLVRTPAQFVAEACLVQVGTFFLLPYFFTLLAKSDSRGRIVAVAPAFVLTGVATGPLIATLLSNQPGNLQLGGTAAALVLGSTTLFGLSSVGATPAARELGSVA